MAERAVIHLGSDEVGNLSMDPVCRNFGLTCWPLSGRRIHRHARGSSRPLTAKMQSKCKASLAWALVAAPSAAVPAPELLSAASRCDQATTQSAYCRGEAHFNDTVLDGLGANGRACATCHVPGEAFQLSPKTVERRY